MTTSDKLRDLIAAGLTQGGIALRVSATQPTISRILNGLQQPLESLSRRVDALHLEICQAQQDERAA